MMIEFLSTPSARRATACRASAHPSGCNFYPRPPRGGRRCARGMSIHLHDFYPRPPRGGRHLPSKNAANVSRFLSTPSARRATNGSVIGKRNTVFLSTPSARRATGGYKAKRFKINDFYPRPPRGGRRGSRIESTIPTMISIHALREEGDAGFVGIYTHTNDFYPRPPRGGRPLEGEWMPVSVVFLSTPSARRATRMTSRWNKSVGISIHALREEGDQKSTHT